MRKPDYLLILVFFFYMPEGWSGKPPYLYNLSGNIGAETGLPFPANRPGTAATGDYIAALKMVTDIMVNDVTSPVAASRYYAYVTLSAYETISLFNSVSYPSLSGKINMFSGPEVPAEMIRLSDQTMAVILCIYTAGEKLLPSGYLLKTQTDSLAALYGKTTKGRLLYRHTVELVNLVVQRVIAYAKADGFTRLTNLKRYTPLTGDGYWKPTPPVFMAPVEPHWNTLRPFVLDSAGQFGVQTPAGYDTAKGSSFFRQLTEVYDLASSSTPQQRDIAMFWDCNPFAVQQIGHVEYGLKKISPGGHWIGITGIACTKMKFSLPETAKAHVLVSIALADAFIACWDEKYRSNRVRPETAIRKLIDPRWLPLLQTPTFPEYVSGHSVASTAAAVILTRIFGAPFPYADDTEKEFGLPVRKYTSFAEAASEAAISRLYGGIHYRDAIEQGEWQGKQIGEYVSGKLKWK